MVISLFSVFIHDYLHQGVIRKTLSWLRNTKSFTTEDLSKVLSVDDLAPVINALLGAKVIEKEVIGIMVVYTKQTDAYIKISHLLREIEKSDIIRITRGISRLRGRKTRIQDDSRTEQV